VGLISPDMKYVRITVDQGSGKVIPLIHKGVAGVELAELQGILVDLEHVLVCLKAINALDRNEDSLRLALLDSALIRYRRCFKNGLRLRIHRSQLADVAGCDLSLHDDMIDMADKYVAHSVNRQEVNVAVVIPNAVTNLADGHMVLTLRTGDLSADQAQACSENVALIIESLIRPWRSRLEVDFEREVALLTAGQVERLRPFKANVNLKGSEIADRR
jgi:hypothetical protein